MAEFHDVFDEMMEEISVCDPEERAGVINDDLYADWAIQKIKADEAERNRLLKTADADIELRKAARAGIAEKYDRKIANLKWHLSEYFAKVPHKKLKASENYVLPSGKLSMKYGKVKQKFVNANGDEDKKGALLVEWLEANGYERFVRVTKEPAWVELKDALVPAGSGWCMAATGEEVEGIAAYRTDDEFEVK